MVILGTENFRHDVMHSYSRYRSFDLALPSLSAAIGEVTQYVKTLGIRTMSENQYPSHSALPFCAARAMTDTLTLSLRDPRTALRV